MRITIEYEDVKILDDKITIKGIKTSTKKRNTTAKVPEVEWTQIKKIANQTGKKPQEVFKILFRFAIDRVEIV